MDIFFGTLASDSLKLFHHRAVRQGIRHDHRITPQDPQPGDPVTVSVSLGADVPADHIACYYTVDGSNPVGERGVAHNGSVISLESVGVEWDTVIWGYVQHWQGTLPAQPEGTLVHYRIGVWCDDEPMEYFADSPNIAESIDRATGAYFRGEPLPGEFVPSNPAGKLFTYAVDRLEPASWAQEAVIYQIFVDRFYPGDDRAWLAPDELTGFYGGTLWGVRDKLDYIVELGATCIWLSPTFVSPTYHGYDVSDFYHVEPRLGGDAALKALVMAAHDRGLRVILDLPCNHLSNQNPTFLDALQNPDSAYRDWFIFDDSPIGYRTYFGVKTMPVINVENPEARQWLIDIARHWLLEFDVDGFRLDHANGPEPGFWAEFWTACKQAKPDCFCYGEVVIPPNEMKAYAGRMDACLDFVLAETLRKAFAFKTLSEADFKVMLERHLAYRDPAVLYPIFLDNHDQDRFLFIAGNDPAKLRDAARVWMELPGPWIIYYGTEVGLSQRLSKAEGKGDKQARLPMLWGNAQDSGLLAFYQSLIQERQNRSSA